MERDFEWCLRMYPEDDLVRVELDLLTVDASDPSSGPSVSARVWRDPEDCPDPLGRRCDRLEEDCE